MGQTSPHRRPWHATFRAAALGSASILVIAALAGDKALGADGVDGTAIQLAQRPTGGGGGRPPAGGTPAKDLTDPNQPWNSQDIANAEKLSKALKDASEQFEGLGEHFVKIGQPGMVQWVKAMLDYFDGLLKALSSNAQGAMFGGGLTPDQGTQVRQTAQRGGDAQKAKEKLEAFEQQQRQARQATPGGTGQAPTPQTPRTGQQTGQAPTTRTPTGQAAQGPTRTPTGQQVAQGPGPNATLIPNNPAGLPTLVQGGTVTGSPQDQLALNTACPADLHASLGSIPGGVPGPNNTVSVNLNALNSAPLFSQSPPAQPVNPSTPKVGISATVGEFTQAELDKMSAAFLAPDTAALAQNVTNQISNAPSPGGVAQPSVGANMASTLQVRQNEFLNPATMLNSAGPSVLSPEQIKTFSTVANSVIGQNSAGFNPVSSSGAGLIAYADQVKNAFRNSTDRDLVLGELVFGPDQVKNAFGNSTVSGNTATGRSTSDTLGRTTVRNNTVSGNTAAGGSTGNTPAQTDAFEWDQITPRLGLTYSLGAERKSLLRASYSRFADQLAANPGGWVNPLGGASYAYFYTSARPPTASPTYLYFDGFQPRGPNGGLLSGSISDPRPNPVTLEYTRNFGGMAGVNVLTGPGGAPSGFVIDRFNHADVVRLPPDGQSCGDLPPSDLKGASGWSATVPGAGGVCQPFQSQPIWGNTLQLYQTERPQEQYKADASSFFNTGSLSHELKFGAGYRQAEVESRSFWDGSGYNLYDGPSRTGAVQDTHIFSSNFYLTGLYSQVATGRWGDYGSAAVSCPPPRTVPQGWEQETWLTTQAPHPNDPLLNSRGTWRQSYDDQWWLKAINWLKPDGTSVLPQQGRPVTVAVIDTGLDIRHPDLFGAVWVNPNEPRKGPPGMWRNPAKMRLFGWNFVNDSADLRDLNGHGTIVAGIIAANVNNGQGIAGVNPWARIMPLKVADHRGRASTFKTAKAIVFAADNGARVINLSLGANLMSEVVKRAIDYAAKKNVLVVVSAGNESVDVKGFTPSAFANTIAVAAVDTESNRAGFSNFGDNITISAPGVDILSLRAGGTDLMMYVRKDYQRGSAVVNDRYYRVDGTSFAAPMVAGVASLILSMRPELSAADVKRMVLQSARDIGDAGRDRNYGYGLLDADAALKADPAFFVDGMIDGLSVVQASGRQAVRVTGTAAADRMRAAWIELGEGENPTQWKKVSEDLTRPVERGVISDVPTTNFAGAKVWTVRVVVEHQNGRKREGRYVLRLG